MGWIVGIVAALAGLLASLFVAPDAANFGVVQGVLSLFVVVAALGLVAIFRR